jgi:hypothetical protein
MFKHKIQRYIIETYWSGWDKAEFFSGKGMCEFGAMSCEMLATELIDKFELTRCEVSEDNENGAFVTRISNVV